MRYQVTIEGVTRDVEVEATDQGWRARIDDGPWLPVSGEADQGELRVDGLRLGAHVEGSKAGIQVRGTHLTAEVVDPRRARGAMGGGAAEGEIRTPMPGVVVRIPVTEGERVKAGQVVVVVEAMKMENEFKATIDGVVAGIEVEVGQALEADAVLARVDAD